MSTMEERMYTAEELFGIFERKTLSNNEELALMKPIMDKLYNAAMMGWDRINLNRHNEKLNNFHIKTLEKYGYRVIIGDDPNDNYNQLVIFNQPNKMAHEPDSNITKAMGKYGRVAYCGPWGVDSDKFRVKIMDGFSNKMTNTMAIMKEMVDLLPEYPNIGTATTDENNFDVILKK